MQYDRYTVRSFPSATGHTFYQVMSPLGHKVYESLELAKAQENASRRNTEAGF